MSALARISCVTGVRQPCQSAGEALGLRHLERAARIPPRRPRATRQGGIRLPKPLGCAQWQRPRWWAVGFPLHSSACGGDQIPVPTVETRPPGKCLAQGAADSRGDRAKDAHEAWLAAKRSPNLLFSQQCVDPSFVLSLPHHHHQSGIHRFFLLVLAGVGQCWWVRRWKSGRLRHPVVPWPVPSSRSVCRFGPCFDWHDSILPDRGDREIGHMTDSGWLLFESQHEHPLCQLTER